MSENGVEIIPGLTVGKLQVAGYNKRQGTFHVMTEPRKLRVFLCHASQDKPAACELWRKIIYASSSYVETN